MGNLKSGTKFIYEHVDGITYAREFGSPGSERFEIGRTLEKQTLDESLRETELWYNILRAAKSNTTLQDALDRVKIMYELSKDHGKK